MLCGLLFSGLKKSNSQNLGSARSRFTHGPYESERALGAAGLFSCVGFVLLAGKLARGAWSWAAAPEVDSELVARLADPCRVSRVGNCA